MPPDLKFNFAFVSLTSVFQTMFKPKEYEWIVLVFLKLVTILDIHALHIIINISKRIKPLGKEIPKPLT